MAKEKLLVTMDERRLIAKEMSIEFGTKIKYRVIDLDKAIDYMIKQRSKYSLAPYIEIKPVSVDMHKQPSRTATFQKDPVTGVLYGIPIDQDEFGNMRWQKPQIGDNLSLNLDNRNEAKVWAVLRFFPELKGSPFQVQNPYYEVHDPIEIARREISEVEQMKKAFDRISMIERKPVELVMFTRYLGEDVRDNSSIDIVTNQLLRFARNYPDEFNRRWENKSRAVGERFASATAIGVITQDIDRGYMYRNIPLGLSEEEAIRLLAKDMNLMNSINEALTEKDTVVKMMKNEQAYIDSNKKSEKDLKDAGNILTLDKTGTGAGKSANDDLE